MLVMLALVGVLYLTPIPDYVRGTHPDMHHVLFFGSSDSEGTHDDLVKFPSLPLYLLFFSIQSLFLFGAFYETLERMNLIKSKGVAFPNQPHVFGTAPNFLAPILSDIRWHPSHMGVSSSSPEYQAPLLTATMPPRLLYLCLLTFASLPLPLLTFGAGSFANSGWWSFTPAVLIILCICEAMIDKFEKDALGLNGMKYSYKGA